MRYFFDITDGETRPDHQGMELPNDAAARQEARLRALHPEATYRLEQYGSGHRQISVRDETGRIIFEIPLDKGRGGPDHSSELRPGEKDDKPLCTCRTEQP